MWIYVFYFLQNQSSNKIPPSASSKVNDSPFPALCCKGVQPHSEEEENDKDYQPSNKIPPSVSSKVNDSPVSALCCKGVQPHSEEDENDKDYQPSKFSTY